MNKNEFAQTMLNVLRDKTPDMFIVIDTTHQVSNSSNTADLKEHLK